MHYLVTGAGSGIGKAIAIKLASEGHQCYLLGRNEQKLRDTLSVINGAEDQLIIADVANDASMSDAVSFRPHLILDGIIANAGIGGENHFGTQDRWNMIINTNLTGTYNTIQYFLTALSKRSADYGQIVIMSSVLARLGVANYAAYCASKAGLLGLMRSWAVSYAPQKILVNAICPGWVNTDMAQDGLQGIADGIGITKDAFFEMAMQSVPLRKMSEPEEIAHLVSYLLAQKSITGQTIDINAGSVMNS